MKRKRIRVKRKKPFFKKPLFSFMIFLSLFLIGGVYSFFFSDLFKVKEIEILGSNKIQLEDFDKFLKSKIENKNIFLEKLQPIKNELLKNFPQVFLVEVERKFPSKLIFKISERKEVANFCQNETCYLIDREGIVFGVGREESLLKIEKAKLDEEIKPGKSIIEREILTKILEISKRIDFEIESVLIVSEDDLHFKTKQGWEIIIDPEKDIDWQLTKLKVAIENAIPKEKMNDLEYIDLRFGNFAYPKYKK
jgi:cell division septal protein FtsQ